GGARDRPHARRRDQLSGSRHLALRRDRTVGPAEHGPRARGHHNGKRPGVPPNCAANSTLSARRPPTKVVPITVTRTFRRPESRLLALPRTLRRRVEY